MLFTGDAGGKGLVVLQSLSFCLFFFFKVIFLEKRVTELEKDTVANGEQHSRLKQENLQLVHR